MKGGLSLLRYSKPGQYQPVLSLRIWYSEEQGGVREWRTGSGPTGSNWSKSTQRG